MTLLERQSQLVEVYKPVFRVYSILLTYVPQIFRHRFIFPLFILIRDRLISTAEEQLNKCLKFLACGDAIVVWIEELAVELN
jgi:hypothetical protein